VIDSIVVWAELPCVDRVLFTDARLDPGAKIVVSRSMTRGGGVGGNFAAALRLFDMDATAVGLASTDPLGQSDYRDLRERGVHVLEVAPASGSVDPIICTLIVPTDSDRTILIEYPSVGPQDYAALRDGFADAITAAGRGRSIGVYLGVLRPHPALALAQLTQKPRFVACTLETSDWPTSTTTASLDWVDVVFVADETFAAHRDEIARWQRNYSFDLIVTLGSQGARSELRDGTVESFEAASPADKVVDTSGAGDCFAATYCAHAWTGTSHRGAMSSAAVAAADHITRAGARTSRDRYEVWSESIKEVQI